MPCPTQQEFTDWLVGIVRDYAREHFTCTIPMGYSVPWWTGHWQPYKGWWTGERHVGHINGVKLSCDGYKITATEILIEIENLGEYTPPEETSDA